MFFQELSIKSSQGYKKLSYHHCKSIINTLICFQHMNQSKGKKVQNKVKAKPFLITLSCITSPSLLLVLFVLKVSPSFAFLDNSCSHHFPSKSIHQPFFRFVIFDKHLHVVSRTEEERVRVSKRRAYHRSEFGGKWSGRRRFLDRHWFNSEIISPSVGNRRRRKMEIRRRSSFRVSFEWRDEGNEAREWERSRH